MDRFFLPSVFLLVFFSYSLSASSIEDKGKRAVTAMYAVARKDKLPDEQAPELGGGTYKSIIATVYGDEFAEEWDGWQRDYTVFEAATQVLAKGVHDDPSMARVLYARDVLKVRQQDAPKELIKKLEEEYNARTASYKKRLGAPIVEEYIHEMAQWGDVESHNEAMEMLKLSGRQKALFDSFTDEEWAIVDARIVFERKKIKEEEAWEAERKREAREKAMKKWAVGALFALAAVFCVAGVRRRRGEKMGIMQWSGLVCAAMLLVALFPTLWQWAEGGGSLVYKLPYGYFTLMRLFVAAFCCMTALIGYSRKAHIAYIFVPVVIAIMYQPIDKVELDRVTWGWVNAATIPALIAFAAFCGSRKSEDEGVDGQAREM